MKQTKKMYPGCVYLFEGQSSSSSCFIQSETDAKSFMTLANYNLKDFLKIHEYNLTKDSWIMVVSLRSREKIFKSYHKKRDKSQTCNRKYDHCEIWKIISEQVRQFLRSYVYAANKRSGREGSLVREPYKRSYFETIQEAKEYINNLRNQLMKKRQSLKKYRGRKKFYKIHKKRTKGHIYLCSRWKNSRESIDRFFKKVEIDIQALFDYYKILSDKLILRTVQAHI